MKPDEIEKRLKNALIYGTSHPETYKTKADELWEKYHLKLSADWQLSDDWCVVEKSDFLAALKEYGELVKASAVKVCDNEKDNHVMSKYARVDDCRNARLVARSCAAAIEKMELP